VTRAAGLGVILVLLGVAPVQAPTGLKVAIVHSPAAVTAEDALTFQITIRNPSEANATGLTLLLDFSRQVSLVSIRPTSGCRVSGQADPAPSAFAAQITCELPDLGRQATQSVVVVVRSPVSGPLTAQARVGCCDRIFPGQMGTAETTATVLPADPRV
jgi:hypothetical protein